MRRSLLLLLTAAAGGSLCVLYACVGDTAVTTPPLPDGGGSDTSVTDTSSPVDTGSDGFVPACDTTKAWGTPVLLAGVNSTDAEVGVTLTADELTIVFASNRTPGSGSDFNFWIAQRSSKTKDFNAPTILESVTTNGINTTADERGVSMSGDGTKLVFRSSRTNNYDLYASTRPSIQAPFSAPVPLNDLNTNGIENTPSLNLSATRLTYGTQFADGGAQFFEATPNGNGWTKQPVVGDFLQGDDALMLTNDGLHGFFGSHRAPNAGSSDIWATNRSALDQPFVTGNVLTNLNSAAFDSAGWISPDGCHIYLSSARGGNFHIFVAERVP
jgi:WD40-like Beta Propeller Repeat